MLSPSPNFLPATPESNQKPGPSNVDLFHLDENGELNLSNNGLKKLENHHKNVYQKAVSVNLSKNLFATIDGMIMFSNCTKMNVSYNKLQRLTCFLPLRDKLKYLDISNNQLISVDHLEKFVLLSHFDASHNKLESIKYVDKLNNLVYLNLAYNQLKFLPKLDKLQNLEELNLRGNQIRSLEDITVNLPLKLNKFDIGENLVNDLSEIQYLAPFTELETLHFAGNPCVKEEGREFTYRPFVYSCILSKLKIIDGYILSEEEVLKGEWLHAQGKAKSFRPQTVSHLALCEYLTQECPLDAAGNPLKTENDVRLLKVLQKRREYLSHSEDDSSLSVSIPLRTPSQKNSPQTYLSPSGKRGLRTASPKRPLDFSTSPKSRNSSRTSIFPIKSVSTTADEESPSSMASDLSSSTIVLSRVDEVEPLQVTVCESAKKPSDDYQRQLHVPTVHEVAENRYLESIPEASKEDRLVSPTPVIRRTRSRVTVSDRLIFNEQSSTSNDIGKTMNEETAATLIQSWWRGSKVRRRLVDAKLQFAVDSNRSKIAALQNQLDKVIEENERLTTITEEQMNAINTMSKQIKEMQESIEGLQKFQLVVKHLVPTPVSLVYQRDLENNSLVLTWENTIPLLSVVKGYKLFADGESIGEVVASNKRARITDLEPEKEHRIAIQAISSFGLTSAISEVVVPKLDSDDKENLHQTKPDPSRKE